VILASQRTLLTQMTKASLFMIYMDKNSFILRTRLTSHINTANAICVT